MEKLSSMFLLSALFIVIFVPVNGIHAETTYVIGGFDHSRGGAASLEQGDYLDEARASIAAHFPEVSLTSTSSLTPEFLAGIDILLISSITSNTTCIQPLSTSEQTALYDFVLGGGYAILLPDNSSFGGTGTPAANESLIDPFGLDIAGTASGRQIATTLQPSESIITCGPYGEITSFSQACPGGITNLGPYAAPLATNALGYALAVIEPGTMSTGSGGVVIYSDMNTYVDTEYVGYFPENEALFLNTINFCLGSLSAEVTKTLELPKGWSMISLPVVPESLILSDVFPGALVVYGFQRNVGYVRIQEDEALEVGKGYWILLDEARTYTFTGAPIHEYTCSVEDGWCMIGGCTNPAQVIPHHCEIDVIYGFNQEVGYKPLLESEPLEPGEGYWIKFSDTHVEAAFTATIQQEEILYYLDDFDNEADSLNNFITHRDHWCCNSGDNCSSVCDDNKLSVSFDKIIRYGSDGASLKINYNVQQEDTLVSYYESLYSGSTFYDLSAFEKISFWVKGEDNTVGNNTKFYIRFTDKDWNMEYVEIVGVQDEWEEKSIDIHLLTKVDWKQMRELTIIFENNRDNSGRVSHPLDGVLYFDNFVFVEKVAEIDSDENFLDLLEKRAFRYFWEYADPDAGLIRDRATDPDVCSIAAVGFGLTAICIAESRGWITYEQAYNRVLTTLNSFYDDPNDSDDFCVEGTHGLFWHFVNIHDGKPMYWDGVSTIDSALLMAGILTCKQYFSCTEIETLATKIYENAEWDWFLNNDELMYAKWTPAEGLTGCWGGYNEAMILYLLAIGSPTHSIPPTSWDVWTSFYKGNWGAYYGHPVLSCPTLFTHQYSHCWIDFRDKKDEYVNYFQNSIFATLANRAYSKDIWYPGSDIDLWGITVCDGPIAHTCSGKTYRIGLGYPPDTGNNDGTIAPTAAGGSIVFTPECSISTLRYMYKNYHQRLWGLFGLKDSLNVRCELDWFDNDYIGIDVGAMLIMIENYRSNLAWKIFMKNEEITNAMDIVGFTRDDKKEQCFYYQEAENFELKSGNSMEVEYHPTAWNKKTLQVGTDPDNFVTYQIDIDCECNINCDCNNIMFFRIRYSDDVAGNKIEVFLDDVKKGSFITDKFGGWDDFDWDDEIINLGTVTPGRHDIKLNLATDGGGSYGVNLDVFKLYAIPDE